MKKRFRKLSPQPKNPDDLFNVLSEMWEALPETYFGKLANSMASRVVEVKRVKSSSIKY